jgi:hypothetical protein
MDWVDTSWVTQIYLLLLFYIIKRIISTSFFPFQMFSFRYEERIFRSDGFCFSKNFCQHVIGEFMVGLL